MSAFRRMMTYLGLVDEDEYEDYEYDEPQQQGAPARQPQPAAVQAASPEPSGIRTIAKEPETMTPLGNRSVVRPITPMPTAKVQTVTPTSFQDAQEIGDRYKAGMPVIVNLQAVERDLMRRIIDFASGLTYGLGGEMEKAADRVFLLTPTNVEVSAEEKRRLQERGLYRS